jgi:hypothetical protein
MTENTSNAIASKYPFTDLQDQHSPEILRVLAIGSPPVVDSFVMSLSLIRHPGHRKICPNPVNAHEK